MKKIILKKRYVVSAIIMMVLMLCSVFYIFGRDCGFLTADFNNKKKSSATEKPSEEEHNSQLPETPVVEKEIDVDFYAKRIYELSYLFGINHFERMGDIPVSALVQYSFCHLFEDSLVDAKPFDTLIYRQAVESSILSELKKHFSVTEAEINDLDTTKSDLYNQDKKIFEMWQPNYSRDVYYDAKYEKIGDDKYQITVAFYNGKNKETIEKNYSAVLIKRDEFFLFTELS